MADGTRTIHIILKEGDGGGFHFTDVFRVLVEKGIMKLWHESGDYNEFEIAKFRVHWD